MREIIQKIAGECPKSSFKPLSKENDRITAFKKLSGLYEDFESEKKIYIHETKDIEKFYYALIEAVEDADVVNTIKEVFSRVRY